MARTKQSSKKKNTSKSEFVAVKEPRRNYPQGARVSSSSRQNQSKDRPTKRSKPRNDDDTGWTPSSDSDADAVVATTTPTSIAAAASTSLAYSASSTSTGLTLDGMVAPRAAAAAAAASGKRVTRSASAASSTSTGLTLDGMVAPRAAAAAAAVAKKPKAKKPKAKKSKAEKPKATKSKKPKRNSVKEAMKQKAKEYEEARDKEAWIKTCEPAKETLPKTYKDCKIDNVRVYDMTRDAICEIKTDQVPDFSANTLCALMKMIGGKLYGSNKEMLRNAFTEFLLTGNVEKGFSNSNRSEGMRTLAAACNLAKPDKANPLASLLTLVTDPDLLSVMEHVISIERARIVIKETPDGQEESNLQMITNAMDDTRGINGRISVFLNKCFDMRFVIGPSSHGYYDGEHVLPASYERQRLDLIHPDITENIEPDNNISSMRKFY